MVSAELAAALPVLVLLAFVGIFAVRVVDARIRCLDAARDVARALARHDEPAAAAARADAPRGAIVAVTRTSRSVRVTVSAAVRPTGTGLAEVTVRETATAVLEPDAAAARPPPAREHR
jgi:hypothetical protein